MNHLENLAPAGTPESLERAIAGGADAVYLGYAAFSARAGAGNFDENQLREAIRLAHLHHVRVHVTVNTLVKDGELEDVAQVLRLLDDAGADAVLIQDLGVVALAKACVPGLPIHASTQMALHNAAGARFAKRMGMQRVVLARECSLDEIRKAAAEDIEIEVFGHGAQCVGVSGECLFSSMLGERSGNRGRCAQPCRLLYTYRGQKGAWLSPRDVCLREDLKALKDAGACSVKLEGRLKRPEYVQIVSSAYRRGIDAMNGADPHAEKDLLALRQIFSRGGFMRGYAMGCEDAGVIYPERVNHSGVPLGSILSVKGGMARCAVTAVLHDGDSLQVRGDGYDEEMLYSGPEVPCGGTALLRLRPDMNIRAGDAVYRLADAQQLEEARRAAIPPIPVQMWLTAMPDHPLSLTVSDGESTVTVSGDTVQSAQKRALTKDDAARSLGKTGDTAFAMAQCEVETENAFVPVSALNNIRREALDQLAEARIEAFARPNIAQGDAPAVALPSGAVPPVVISRDARPDPALVPAGTRLVWYPEDWRSEALAQGLSGLAPGTWLQLPPVCEEDTLQMIAAQVHAHADTLGGVVLGSVGQLGIDWSVPFAAGSGIPVMNRRAAQVLFSLGCAFVTASPELTGRELRVLMQGEPPIVVPSFGRTQLMLLHHCPARTLLGLTEGHAACRLCDHHAPDALEGTCLTDRRGYDFPLQRLRLPEGCLIRLMNTCPTDVRAQISREGWPQMWELTDDPRGTAQTTQGHWNRAVE